MKFLFKAGIVACDRCTFCYLERETIVHLFFECNKVKNSWLRLYSWFNLNNITAPHISVDIVILGYPGRLFLDKILFVTKCYMYRSRCLQTNISLTGLLSILNISSI